MKIPALIKNSKGFTLIELLVVIGILGILAAALLQTIDPFEQLRKGRDTVRRNTAIEFLNANTRYYASHGSFPWDATNGVAGCNEPTGDDFTQIQSCILALEADGELKEGFLDAITDNGDATRLFTTSVVDSGTINVCYSPESKSELRGSLTKFNEQGIEDPGQCGNPDIRTNGTCFQCFR